MTILAQAASSAFAFFTVLDDEREISAKFVESEYVWTQLELKARRRGMMSVVAAPNGAARWHRWTTSVIAGRPPGRLEERSSLYKMTPLGYPPQVDLHASKHPPWVGPPPLCEH